MIHQLPPVWSEPIIDLNMAASFSVCQSASIKQKKKIKITHMAHLGLIIHVWRKLNQGQVSTMGL